MITHRWPPGLSDDELAREVTARCPWYDRLREGYLDLWDYDPDAVDP